MPKVPTWWLEWDSNLRPSGRKAPNLPLSHHVPQFVFITFTSNLLGAVCFLFKLFDCHQPLLGSGFHAVQFVDALSTMNYLGHGARNNQVNVIITTPPWNPFFRRYHLKNRRLIISLHLLQERIIINYRFLVTELHMFLLKQVSSPQSSETTTETGIRYVRYITISKLYVCTYIYIRYVSTYI